MFVTICGVCCGSILFLISCFMPSATCICYQKQRKIETWLCIQSRIYVPLLEKSWGHLRTMTALSIFSTYLFNSVSNNHRSCSLAGKRKGSFKELKVKLATVPLISSL